ncbi:ras-related protein Rab-37-like isoform X3 [Daphnia carinata]|uniref:ras-related protein Rab-37-like isoform X3 n=1 Tax=Daphnia carinata TaxID=120202 RepID=UPI0028690ADA|nr:ras-related protein Rab-37-like isoform X3 [Daphnia carinata]
MLTLAQLGSNLKRQTVSNDLSNKEAQSDPSTYRFIQVRGSSFRTKSKDNRIKIKDTNNVHYDFRGPSAVNTDEQTCAQFKNKVLVVDGAKVKLQIWDTAGQERFRSVTHAYYRDAHALFLLYDVTNRKSFDNTRAWLAEINEYAHRDVIIMLLGNKCDSEDRVVNREDGERLGREYKVNFMETSAKTGLNVDVAFTEVARALRDKRTTVSASYGVQEYVEPRQWSQNVCSACNTS